MFNDGSEHVDFFMVLFLKVTTYGAECKFVPLTPFAVNTDGVHLHCAGSLKARPNVKYTVLGRSLLEHLFEDLYWRKRVLKTLIYDLYSLTYKHNDF
jgi:hypothetical protein